MDDFKPISNAPTYSTAEVIELFGLLDGDGIRELLEIIELEKRKYTLRDLKIFCMMRDFALIYCR